MGRLTISIGVAIVRRYSEMLFPLTGVMFSAVGILAFLAIALGVVMGHAERTREVALRMQIELEGAPQRARPVPIECRSDGVTLRESGVPARFYPLDRLRKEAAIVRDLHDRSSGQAGGALSRDQEWLFFKAVIERDVRLKGSFTLALHLMEMANLKGDARNSPRREDYPILLVFVDGVPAYDLVTYLLETTSRLPAMAEPMLPGWGLTQVQDSGPIGLMGPARSRSGT